MRETILKCVSDTGAPMEETTHNLKGFGNKLMMRPNFMTFIAKVRFKV